MTRIVQVGLGPLGQQMVRFALERGNMKLIAALDPAASKVGREVGELCGLPPLGLRVKPDLASALKCRKPQVAVLATVSDLKRIEPQVRQLAEAKLNIVTTCEELSFPWNTAPRIAERIDATCRSNGVACVSTGVNPGFLMDFLPSVLTGVCQQVERIIVRRIQDASQRRVPFQQKIGAGLTRAEFKRKQDDGTLRHVGLPESVDMIAHAMGWQLERTTEVLRPVIAKQTITSGYTLIKPGGVCGVEQVASGYVNGQEVIRLEFRAGVGELESVDSVDITGQPDLKFIVPGGVNGDVATCAIVLNAIRAIQVVEPGLKTMLDLPAVTFSAH